MNCNYSLCLCILETEKEELKWDSRIVVFYEFYLVFHRNQICGCLRKNLHNVHRYRRVTINMNINYIYEKTPGIICNDYKWKHITSFIIEVSTLLDTEAIRIIE